jgi:hypothetical protein
MEDVRDGSKLAAISRHRQSEEQMAKGTSQRKEKKKPKKDKGATKK